MPHLQPEAPRRVNVYVDETGDRGIRPGASPFFAMTAVMVPTERDRDIRFTAAGLRAYLNTPERQPLHWTRHFKRKHHGRRTEAAERLAAMTSNSVIHVITDKKTALGDWDAESSEGEFFYHRTTRILLEQVAQASRGWNGGPRLAIVRLGTVKGMDHAGVLEFLARSRLESTPTPAVPWEYIKWPPVWRPASFDGIQIADIYSGLLNSALSGDPTDPSCASDLLTCRRQLYRGGRDSDLLGYGVRVIGDERFVTGRSWWESWRSV